MVDIINQSDDPCDLSSDHAWEHWLRRLKEFDFVLLEPVCASFSPARRHSLTSADSGPRPLRNSSHPYGLKTPTPPFTTAELEQLKSGNHFGQRSLLFARAARALGIPSAIESPEIVFDDQASIFLFTEAKMLRAMDAREFSLDQCMFGAESTKPTTFLVTAPIPSDEVYLPWASLTRRCDHRRLPWYTSAHPPLLGKRGSQFRSGASQVYPPALNKALAQAIWDTMAQNHASRAAHSTAEPLVKHPRLTRQTNAIIVDLCLEPQGRCSLSGRTRKAVENEEAIGGLRSPSISLASLPHTTVVGSQIGKALRAVIQSSTLPIIGSTQDIDPKHYSGELLDKCRASILSIVGPLPQWAHSISPVRGDMLWAIAHAMTDPDEEVANWFKAQEGTPMGLEATMKRTGIFPPVPDDRVPLLDPLTYSHGWQNYQSAEADPEVVRTLIAEMTEAGWCREFDSLKELSGALDGAQPLFSKLGLISKARDDGSLKHRMIWDLLRSNINASATQSERIILPRLIDLVNDTVDLMTAAGEGEEVWIFIMDVKNAFHLLPLRPDERRYFCTSAFGKLQLYLVMLFGPKAAPSAWGRFGALLSRVTQAVITSRTARLQFYVDDPACAIVGTTLARSTTVHVILLLWLILGLPLSWGKAQYSKSVTWIGAVCTVTPTQVDTTITAPKLAKAREQALKIMSKTIASRKELASLAGTLGHFAGIVPTLWPFIRPLWAVLYDTAPSSIPLNMFHTSRILTSVSWFLAFLSDPARLLTRTFSLRTPPLDAPSWLRVSVDASPWGMGGVKWDHQWRPTEYFHTGVSADDQAQLGITIGESAHMPVLEALAILIAVRLWAPEHEIAYSVRSDALGAIQALANLRSPNPGVNRVAAELALDIVDKQYAPMRITHIPGVSNVFPDYLSRLLQPGVANPCPKELATATRVETAKRDLSWWRTFSFEKSLHAQK